MAQGEHGNFIWYELMTDDPAVAKEFYHAIFGWRVDAGANAIPGGTEYRMIGRSDGGNAGGVLTLSADMMAQGMKPCWLAYVQTPDVDATAKAIVDAGGAIHMPPTDLPVGRIAMVSDPWGAMFYIMAPIPPAQDPEATSDVFADLPGHVRWHDFWTVDQPAAGQLYRDLFDWQQDGAMPMGDGREYRFMSNGQGMIGGLGQALADGRGPRWDIYIGVDDIGRAIEAAEASGGRALGQPNPVPGGDFAVHMQDPRGAHFGMVGPRKE